MREKDTKKEISLQEKHIYQRSKWISWFPLLFVLSRLHELSAPDDHPEWYFIGVLIGLIFPLIITGILFLIRYLTINAVRKGTVNKRWILINVIIGIAVLFIIGLLLG